MKKKFRKKSNIGNIGNIEKKIYSQINFFRKFFLFWVWFIRDIRERKNNPDLFLEFGLTMFCGRQGDGKTTAMIEYLERMRKKYPKVIILSNFGYTNETQAFEGWNDLLNVRNGDYGVIFALDELQNEFSTAQSKNFPESLLAEITQQRKQRIKIVATSQIFRRVAKPLREATYEVVECKTLLSRWTFTKAFDADDYNEMLDSNNPNIKHKIKRKYRKNFIQDTNLRELFNSYAKVERVKKLEYIRKVD